MHRFCRSFSQLLQLLPCLEFREQVRKNKAECLYREHWRVKVCFRALMQSLKTKAFRSWGQHPMH